MLNAGVDPGFQERGVLKRMCTKQVKLFSLAMPLLQRQGTLHHCFTVTSILYPTLLSQPPQSSVASSDYVVSVMQIKVILYKGKSKGLELKVSSPESNDPPPRNVHM